MRTKRDNTAMYKAIQELQRTRIDNLRKAAQSAGGWEKLAKFLGVSQPFLSQLCGPNPARAFSEKVARNFEQSLGVPFGYLDIRH
jgi:hypothetical protein